MRANLGCRTLLGPVRHPASQGPLQIRLHEMNGACARIGELPGDDLIENTRRRLVGIRRAINPTRLHHAFVGIGLPDDCLDAVTKLWVADAVEDIVSDGGLPRCGLVARPPAPSSGLLDRALAGSLNCSIYDSRKVTRNGQEKPYFIDVRMPDCS